MYNFKNLEEFMNAIMERLDSIDRRLRKLENGKSVLDGDQLLDNQDLCEILMVTKRTLARYRQKKLIAYYMLDGKTYYKSSEIDTFLKRKGKYEKGGNNN